MKKKFLQAASRALMIVAHPDDETIWAGGIILANPKIDWTILCLCRASDKDRAPKFVKVAKALGARGIIEDLEDEGRLSLKASIKPIKKIIQDEIGRQSFDYIFTHGENGEYGHERHVSTHLAVVELVKTKRLVTSELWCFHYKKLSKYKLASKAGADCILDLSPKLFKQKTSLMSEIYGFDPKGIDAGYCTNPESYKLINF